PTPGTSGARTGPGPRAAPPGGWRSRRRESSSSSSPRASVGLAAGGGVGGGDEAADLRPPELLLVHHRRRLALRVLQAEGMVDELDQVAVGVVDVGEVLTRVLATSLVGIGAAHVRSAAAAERSPVRDVHGVEVGEGGLPVVHLEGEVAGGNRRGGGRLGEVNLGRPEPELELTVVEGGATIEELGAQDLRVPV